MRTHYYFIAFNFIQGEYNVVIKNVFKSESEDKEALAHDYLMSYYGPEATSYDEEYNWYGMDCDSVIMNLDRIQEIPVEDYEILKNYL